MTHHRSVNDLLAGLNEFDGKPVELEGVLAEHAEGYELLHYPKVNRRGKLVDGEDSYEPAVWLAPDNGSLQLNTNALQRWVGKRVRVYGVVQSIASLKPVGSLGRGGFGPWGFWPSSIEPYSVQRVTADERREHDV